jgi:glycosyltransferase involved in cell wall biosynthesis
MPILYLRLIPSFVLIYTGEMASHHAVDNPKKEAVLVVVIPAFNEERFIGSVVLGARQYAQTVIVVDDGSTDATAALAEAGGALVLRHEANLGKGAALNTGFQKARALGAEMVVILDGDGQHRADEIPNIVQPIQAGSADMVLGSRYMGEENAAPFYRKVGQVVMTWLTNASSGVHMTDTLSGYRAFSRRALERIDFHEGGWGAETELQFQAHDLHLKIAELPIHVVYQERAKRNPVAYSLHIINAVMRLVGQHRPSYFLGSAD